ncbi:5-oxoprolinase subunit PxpB [Limibacter armeniacum]|uniref:5-oxoprolinase subunit PxpB n=1 Tax=Limibacter armeniacum TaxID=466084 RepID=UPI002FE68C6C
MKFHYTCMPIGDAALLISFGDQISEEINQQVICFCNTFEKLLPIDGIIELIPSYNSVTIIYNPMYVSYDSALDYLPTECLDENTSSSSNTIEIPVCYDYRFGMDLQEVASLNRLSVEEVIQIHTSGTYKVYMLGFMPGFMYLGGLNEKITCPRKQQPRQKVYQGSVGIAGNQTGIYPMESPAGWQIIGRTPIAIFSPFSNPHTLAKQGDLIKFKSITVEEFEEIQTATMIK